LRIARSELNRRSISSGEVLVHGSA
jgi:hypothetical protein